MTTKKVLLVEDNEDTRRMMRLIIELNGYEVVEAADGIEAIDVAESQHPDLIFIDIGLPRLDGVAAILLGEFLNCPLPAGADYTLEELLVDLYSPLGVPVITGLPVGHGTANHPWYYGGRGHLAGGVLTLLPPPPAG